MTIARRVLLVVVAMAGAEEVESQRLLVDNRSGQAADVYRWQYTGSTGSWQLVKRVEAGATVVVCDVRDGARFRAIYGTRYRQYTVQRPAESVQRGGRPDVWVIRE